MDGMTSHIDETDTQNPKLWTGDKEMDVRSVDLYQHFGLTPPQGAAAELTVWHYGTPVQIGGRRTRPAVLILPGGAYRWTSDRESEPVALRFAALGYIPFVLHYSCAPLHFPVSLREAAMAMRYIRENAETFDVDPHMVAAMGFSAGGHLCGTLGTLYDGEEVADIGPGELIRPDALGLCYPVAVSWGRTHEESFENISGGDKALRERLSLEKLVRGDMPPVFLWHTREDASVPCRNSLVLACALEEAGVDFTFHLYHKGRHGLSNADETVYPAGAVPPVSWDVPSWLETMVRFFAEKGLKIKDWEG